MSIDLGSVQLPVSASSWVAVYRVTQWPGLCGIGDSELQLLQEAVVLGDKVKLLAVF